MLQQAQDCLDEGEALHEFLQTLGEEDWSRPTPFKNKTPLEVVAHLHASDRMALFSLEDPEDFLTPGLELMFEVEKTAAQVGPNVLLGQWHTCFVDMCTQLGESDPKRRLQWPGPGMGVLMFTTARQMETWAHGQDIYDLMRAPREQADRLKNIAHIGVKTYGWTFLNREQEIPGPEPYIKLTAPSGATWEWNDPNTENYVEGDAVQFCRVVTQGRNIADTQLTVVGEPATQWMAIAQCFAGPAVDPPAPGERAWD